MTTPIAKIMPVLRVMDLQRSINWYMDILGFQLLWREPGYGEGENRMLPSGDAEWMLSTGAHLGGKREFTGTLCFNGDGIEALYERPHGRVDLVWPSEVMEFGTREFGIRDPDGYTIAFAEEA
jgi:catechol 2,3-dioxygenase-like lactoylglutathione lyase family enzyme